MKQIEDVGAGINGLADGGQERSASDPRLARAMEEYQTLLAAGEKPDRKEFLARYPELAGVLADCLDGLDFLHVAATNLSKPAADGTPALGPDAAGPLGDFRLIREVGRGGMGIVYEAEQVSLGRKVALKVLPFAATMDPRHLQRFHNEAKAAACLHHTNIVPVFFVGCERSIHFYVMQFIDGQPLSEIIRLLQQAEKKTPMSAAPEPTAAYQPPSDGAIATSPTTRLLAEATPLTSDRRRGRDYYRKVAELGVQAAEALDHAHQVGIVHRDVKPANLLLDGRGNVWVTDFGLAYMQHGEANLTETGQTVGTPRYMSPEQAMAKRVPIDHRTDVYSLGVTLYELLALQAAFSSEDRQELLRQIAFEEPAKPRRLERAVPAELEIIVLKAMEKRPQDRYATAQELANDLRHWLDDRPIRARRPSWAQVARKWVRRHQATVRAASLLVVALLAIGLGFSFWWVRQQTAAETEARTTFDEAVRLQKDERWSEALSAIHHAQAVLRGFGTNIAFQRQIEELGKDLEMAQRLGEALLQLDDLKDQDHDGDGCIAAYREAFAWYGLDVEQGNASTTAQYIRSRSIPMQLVAALDHWAVLQRWWRGQEWKHLLAVARAADFDEVRNRLRYAWECGDDKAIRDLLASAEVDKLLPIVVNFLGQSLSNQENVFSEQAASALRRAQQRHPADFWINHQLAYLLFRMVKPPQLEEAIRHFMIAVALRPQSPAAHNNLGTVLQDKGHLDEAIAEYREAIRLKKDYADAHYNLGTVFLDKGRLDEAIAESREAIRLKKDFAAAHSTLGIALAAKGRLDEAIAEYREAIRLKKDYAHPHNNLGNALREKGQLDEAIAECREALRLKKDYPEAHNNLGGVLTEKGRLDEAITECHEAIRLKKDYAEAHGNLGNALLNKGQLNEAIAECREALRIMKDSPKDSSAAHNNLGVALATKGQLDEAIVEFREAIRLKEDYAEAHFGLGCALRDKGQLDAAISEYREAIRLKKDFVVAQNELKNALALKDILAKLTAILSGKAKANNPAEQLTLAFACQQPYKRFYAAAAQFYTDAFAAQPRLADDLNAQPRYNAACAAALAGCGQGADADKLDTKERARLRQQALDWLRADLKAYRQVMEKSAGKAGPEIAQRMQHWLEDGDFAGVRGAESLARLPEAERKEWQQFWQQIEALRQRAARLPKATSSARP